MIKESQCMPEKSPESRPSDEMFPPAEAVRIDPVTISKLRQMIDGNPALEKEISSADTEIRTHKKHWAEYSEKKWSGQNKIPLPDFLKAYGIVERNATHHRKVLDKKWTESLRWANETEKQFLIAAESIGKGKFIEVLQLSLLRNGKVISKDATIGSGTEVAQESIDAVLRDLDIVSAAPEAVYVVHNHFDEYQLFALPENEEAKDGLATVGGLSKQDIEFADKLWEETLSKKARVIMTVINERGLVFSYEAGTSQHRD